jgi:hypothetical protein
MTSPGKEALTPLGLRKEIIKLILAYRMLLYL